MTSLWGLIKPASDWSSICLEAQISQRTISADFWVSVIQSLIDHSYLCRRSYRTCRNTFKMFIILIPNDLLPEACMNQTNDVLAFSFKIVAACLNSYITPLLQCKLFISWCYWLMIVSVLFFSKRFRYFTVYRLLITVWPAVWLFFSLSVLGVQYWVLIWTMHSHCRVWTIRDPFPPAAQHTVCKELGGADSHHSVQSSCPKQNKGKD